MRDKLTAPPPAPSATDRPATWEEVSRADYTSAERVMEMFLSQGSYCESDSDLGGKIRFPAEVFEFCATMGEIANADLN